MPLIKKTPLSILLNKFHNFQIGLLFYFGKGNALVTATLKAQGCENLMGQEFGR
jgi:hypothetical protein